MPDITTTSAVDNFMQSADEAAMRAAVGAMHENGSQGVRPVSASRAIVTSGASSDIGYTLVVAADSVDIELPTVIGVTGTIALWVKNAACTITLAAGAVLRIGESYHAAAETLPLSRGLHILATASPYGWALAPGIDPSTKVDTSAIVNDLTTGGTAVPLSAEQGKTLKGLVDTGGGFRGAKVTNTSGATQTIPSSTFTKLQACLDSEVYDTDGWMDSTAKFLPTIAGYYQAEGIWIGTPTGGGFFITALFKNGALHSILGRGVVNATVICGFSGTDTVHLNGTTDYLELYAFHIAGSVTTYTSANYNRFSCRLLGT